MTNQSPPPKRARTRPVRAIAAQPLDPATTTSDDPGDSTQRNFRYQYAYGALLLAEAKAGKKNYVALLCEHHEDLLAERADGLFDGYQVKTSRPENGCWRMTDPEMVNSIGRFVDHQRRFGARIDRFLFVSNTSVDDAAPDIVDQARRGKCPKPFLEHIKSCSAPASIEAPFLDVFNGLVAQTGCSAAEMFGALKCMDIILGPPRDEIDTVVAHKSLSKLQAGRSLTAPQLDDWESDLTKIIWEASSLKVRDPARYTAAILANDQADPVLSAKRVPLTVLDHGPNPPSFRFVQDSVIRLGTGTTYWRLKQKFEKAGLTEQINTMKSRATAAEAHLLEVIARAPEEGEALVKQLEGVVLGTCSDAHLRASAAAAPYGQRMLVDLQDRLEKISENRGELVKHEPYECLVGVAGLLTDDCRVWWGPRFQIEDEE